MELEPIYISLKLAFITTILLFIVGIPLVYWLHHTRSKIKPLIEVVISMPLILPPTVLGYYFLVFFSPNRGLGGWLHENLGLTFVFSFEGLVIASMIYSLPFMIHPIQSGIEQLSSSLSEASYLMGKSKWKTMTRVLIPSIRPSLLVALVLTFAHTIGEFGIVLMIGGSIPGETRVASVAIFDEMEAMNYDLANQYALALLIITLIILLPFYTIKSFRNRQLIR